MPATPTDIAIYTNDGVLLTSPTNPAITAAILAIFPDAQGARNDEIEMFFDSATNAQVLLDEKFGYLASIALHEGIEVGTDLGLGSSAVPVTPQVPTFRIVDEARQIDTLARVVGYSKNLGSDRYAVEVIG